MTLLRCNIQSKYSRALLSSTFNQRTTVGTGEVNTSRLKILSHVPNCQGGTYLGSPLADSVLNQSLGITLQGIKMVMQRISEIDPTCPLETLQLLRSCAGACRVEYACQTSPPSTQLTDLVQHTSQHSGMLCRCCSPVIRIRQHGRKQLFPAAWAVLVCKTPTAYPPFVAGALHVAKVHYYQRVGA